MQSQRVKNGSDGQMIDQSLLSFGSNDPFNGMDPPANTFLCFMQFPFFSYSLPLLFSTTIFDSFVGLFLTGLWVWWIHLWALSDSDFTNGSCSRGGYMHISFTFFCHTSLTFLIPLPSSVTYFTAITVYIYLSHSHNITLITSNIIHGFYSITSI